ncbi:MAG TPA: PAS domain-containing sensor histidine kinase [Mucilaginibacter sp.]|jgi:PAS domain S-box-containing protein|nr:PAS domain-containing sensor histidine kinase [Mucilaginibacter sp.]
MESVKKTYSQLESELDELRYQLEEANDTIDAIRTGQIDALLIKDKDDEHQLYTLKTADQTYRIFIEKMNEGAVTLTREGLILYSNSRFAEMVSMPLEKVMGMDFNTFIGEESATKFGGLIEHAWEDDSKGEIFIKNGEQLIPCLLSCTTLDLDGKKTLSLILTDLSIIRDAEQQLKLKDEFIGIASHELKTPLTSVKGYLQLISHKKEVLPDSVKQYIDKAITSINKLQRLVSDLLDVSKIQAGRLEYALVPTDLTELIRLCVENARHIYPTHQIESHCDAGLTVNGNDERLEQVIMNLINNAVKYSPSSNHIIIEAKKQGNNVRVSVTDFGIGLSEEQKGRIFERFYRVEDKKYMSSGLGMGLYISQEIINNHNGIIAVKSELGKGATFYFDLPLV